MSTRDDTIYVGSLSYQANEDDLHKVFKEFGAIAEVKVIKDRDTGDARGFGFVQFEDKAHVQSAIDGANGADIKGKTITCSLAKPRAERGGGGGGRGGYGGGRQQGGYGGGGGFGGGQGGYGGGQGGYGGGQGGYGGGQGGGYGGGRGGGGGYGGGQW